MTSQINPALINGNFPVQGVDNPSQGFRSNFTNTGVNFQYAANEISDLQSKAILSAPLAGQTQTSFTNNMNGSPLTNAVISDFAELSVNLGTQQNLLTINYGSGHYQYVSTYGAGTAINFAFTGWPANGNYGWITLAVTVVSAADSIVFPSAVVGANGITGATSSLSGTTINFAAAGTYLFTLSSQDGGYTIFISETNPLLQPYNASYENLTSGGTVSLGVTTSYFTSNTTVSTLANGVEGQIKQLVAYTYTGAVSIAVASAGWQAGSAGHVSLDAAGSVATLQFIAGRWFGVSLVNSTLTA